MTSLRPFKHHWCFPLQKGKADKDDANIFSQAVDKNKYLCKQCRSRWDCLQEAIIILIRIYTVCYWVLDFWLIFATIDMSIFKSGRVQCRNWGMKGLNEGQNYCGSYLYLQGLVTLGKFSAILYNGDNFCDILFTCLHTIIIPFWKWIYSKRK